MYNSDEESTIRHLIKRVSIFQRLPERYTDLIVEGFSTVHYRKNEVVFYQDEKSTDLYLVFKGRLKASLINEEDEEFVLCCFKEGDCFGELSLLDGYPRSATVIAMEDSYLGILTRQRFFDIMDNEPRIAIEMLKILSQRLRRADELLGELVFLDVSERLLKTLQEIAESESVMREKGFYKFNKKITQKELASRIGASRESISKAMKILKFRRLIREADDFLLVACHSERDREVI